MLPWCFDAFLAGGIHYYRNFFQLVVWKYHITCQVWQHSYPQDNQKGEHLHPCFNSLSPSVCSQVFTESNEIIFKVTTHDDVISHVRRARKCRNAHENFNAEMPWEFLLYSALHEPAWGKMIALVFELPFLIAFSFHETNFKESRA